MLKTLKILKYIFGTILIINVLIIFLSYNLFVNRTLTKHDDIGFKEKYKKELFEKIKNLKQLNSYLHKKAKDNNISKNDLAFLNLASDIVKERFYYDGYSFYESSENIILYYLGKYVWEDFAAIVVPDDILKKEHAACSQQSIVLMELVKMNGFQVRKVGLNRHFALEAKLKGNWYFFDPTFEPNFKNKRKSLKFLMKNKESLFVKYSHKMSNKETEALFSSIRYGKINQFPAYKMILVHKFCKFYLKNLLILSLILLFSVFLINKKTTYLNEKLL